MNKLTIFSLLIFYLISQIQLTQAQCDIDDWTALKALYESTDGDNWTNRTGWDILIHNQNSPPVNCDLGNLYGISLDNTGRVYDLILPSNQLNGNIPPELSNLSNLWHISMNNNQLTGSIPAELGGLNNLTGLWLANNQLNGSIPAEIGNLNSVITLLLPGNQLTGTIPPELGNLANLGALILSSNQLSGSIPSELGNLVDLTQLAIDGNHLSGCYPGNLSSLCAQISAQDFGNNFAATWEDFCETQAGICIPDEVYNITLPTNYSGYVEVATTLSANGQYSLQNNAAIVYDYSTCTDYDNLENCNPTIGFDNLAANETLWALQKAAEYFSTEHNVTLLPVNSIVQQNEPNSINNAAYVLGKLIYFGAGDNSDFTSITSPDFVGHEFSHYVTWEDDSITDLNNIKEPGALKESFADIFGELIENYVYGSNDWIFGQQVTLNSGGLRSLINPKDTNMEKPCPDYYEGDNWLFFPNYTYAECLSEDRCGIHTNCGVQNHWFYLLSEGGKGVSGIGINKAAKIALNNLKSLEKNATYRDAMFGSILAAKQLYGGNSNEVQQTIQAWKAVGLDVEKYNPITWQIANETQIGEPFVGADGRDRIMMEFDLEIDSLNQDLTADGLEFTLTDQNNSSYEFEHVELKTINPILQPNEVDTFYQNNNSDLTVKINRINNGAAKTMHSYNRIVSRTSIGTFVICIIVIDIGGGNSQSLSLDITGSTQTESAYQSNISFQPQSILFGSNIYNSNENNGGAQYFLTLQMELIHKNCQNMGALEFEIIDANQLSVAPYSYCLKNDTDVEIDGNFQNKNYAFYNLDEGNYELYIEDSSINNRHITKNFKIEFRSDAGGSLCCPNELNIPSGYVYGIYKAVNRILINSGTSIDNGTFEICD